MDTERLYDLIIIGGGINGVGIAADAQGRGLSVLLCEQNDLASGTSSASSKLIHGGLRYLEQLDFSLVRESLRERKILLDCAPHLVHPIRFVLPFNKGARSYWRLRMGLYCYDLLGLGSHFERSKTIVFNTSPMQPLKSSLRRGFSYWDAYVDDARLVITTAMRAASLGATILTRTQCTGAKRRNDHWQVNLRSDGSVQDIFVRAKALVNAAGPWVDTVINDTLHMPSQYQLQLVKGSHIVVPSNLTENQAYLLQHKDGRVIFVIPYQKQFSLIGTTDVEYKGDPKNVKIDDDEIKYLCHIANHYFKHQINKKDIIYSWSGVRALVNPKSTEHASPLSKLTREYKLELLLGEKQQLPLINVFGGKITTHRALAEKAINLIAPYFGHCKKPWTAYSPLPGGDIPEKNVTLFITKLTTKYPALDPNLLERYAMSYGTLTYIILKGVKRLSDLGQHFGHGLYEKEVNYLITNEWAQTVEDILWRRTKLGLFLPLWEQEILEQWLEHHHLQQHEALRKNDPVPSRMD